MFLCRWQVLSQDLSFVTIAPLQQRKQPSTGDLQCQGESSGEGRNQIGFQAVQDVINDCGRQVAGSLSDIAGLWSIKQLLREVRPA